MFLWLIPKRWSTPKCWFSIFHMWILTGYGTTLQNGFIYCCFSQRRDVMWLCLSRDVMGLGNIIGLSRRNLFKISICFEPVKAFSHEITTKIGLFKISP